MKYSNVLLVGFVLVKFLLQFWLVSPEYDLHRDEYLYLDQGNHLAWGYASVPPLTAFFSALIGLLGGSEFWVKFFPALFGSLTLVIVWKATEKLGGNLLACILAGSGVLFSIILRINTLYQPNSFDILAWTMLSYAILRYFQTERPNWLYVAAVILALGILNKYNIVFWLMAMLPAILFTQQRKIFGQKHFYFAMGLTLVLILPNFIWQFQHSFPVLYHMRELAETHLVHNARLDFFRSQIFFFLGGLPILLAGWIFLATSKSFRPYQPFFLFLPFAIALFAYFNAKDYYAIGIYPIYFSFGAVAIGNWAQKGIRKGMGIAAAAIPALIFIPMWQVGFPNHSPTYFAAHADTYRDLGQLRWEDGTEHALPQDYADMLGWRELAQKVDRAMLAMPSPQQTLVLCDNYGQAGAIQFYSRGNYVAHSFHADYLHWIPLAPTYTDLILIKENPAWQADWEELKPAFSRAWIADSLTSPFARERGTTILCFTGAQFNLNQRLRTELEEQLTGLK